VEEIMKVSIITVSYNAVKTIEQTILSIKAQSYTNIEYIIIDGKSTDGTLEIIKKYQKYIDHVICEPDKGIYDAMNKGIRLATGDIIGFANSDDWYEPDTIEKVVTCFNSTDAELTHGIVWVVEEDGSRTKTNGFKNEKVEYEQIYYNMLPHLSVFTRKTVFEQYGGFDIDYQIAADYDWLLRCYTNGVHFFYIDSIMGSFRKGGVSTSAGKLNQLAEENKEISLKYVSNSKNRELILNQIEERYRSFKLWYLAETNPAKIVDTVKDRFLDIAEGIVIFGSGIWGERIYRVLNSVAVPVHFFVDNNTKKWGTEQQGITIKSPEILKTYNGYIIVAVLNHADKICKQLSEMENIGIEWTDLREIADKVI